MGHAPPTATATEGGELKEGAGDATAVDLAGSVLCVTDVVEASAGSESAGPMATGETVLSSYQPLTSCACMRVCVRAWCVCLCVFVCVRACVRVCCVSVSVLCECVCCASVWCGVVFVVWCGVVWCGVVWGGVGYSGPFPPSLAQGLCGRLPG